MKKASFSAAASASLSIRSLVLAGLVISITACMPTIKKIYHTPVVLGQVIDLVTLKPIEGAIVKHQVEDTELELNDLLNADKNQTLSNKQGQYHLPSTSSVKALMLMPGYAVAAYPVRISTDKSAALVFASASLLMRTEETAGAPLLIMDPEPKIIANTPPGDYLDYQLLRTGLYPHSSLGICNLSIGTYALSALNTARKVYWRSVNEADFEQHIVTAAYLNVSNVWQYFYTSCKSGSEGDGDYASLIEAHTIVKKIKQEATDLSLLTEPDK